MEMYPDPETPKWAEATKTHDWRNYISDELREMWSSFSPEQRLAIARNAQTIADQEDWD